MAQKKILFISHDANRAGSQLLLLQMMKNLKKKGVSMHLVLGEGGVIQKDFEEIVPTTILPEAPNHVSSPLGDKVLGKLGLYNRYADKVKQERKKAIENLIRKEEIGVVFVNSIANATLYREELSFLHDLPLIVFAHELGMSVSMYSKRDDLEFMLNKAAHLIVVANAVADYYIKDFKYPSSQISTFTLIDHTYVDQRLSNANKDLLKETHGIPDNAFVIGGCGNAEWRKGNDVFNWIARAVLSKVESKPVYFVWIGAGKQHPIFELISNDIEQMGLLNKIILIPPTPQAIDYIRRFDVFLLSSREDPYPLVVMEAALNQTPVICFNGAGGAPELIEMDAGRSVPYMDISAASEAIVELIHDQNLREQLGKTAREKVIERHNTEDSINKVMAIIEKCLNLSLSDRMN